MDQENDSLRPIYESEGVSVWASNEQVNFVEEAYLESSCLGKDKYPSPAACQGALDLFGRKDLNFYLCTFCNSYHLTSK